MPETENIASTNWSSGIELALGYPRPLGLMIVSRVIDTLDVAFGFGLIERPYGKMHLRQQHSEVSVRRMFNHDRFYGSFAIGQQRVYGTQQYSFNGTNDEASGELISFYANPALGWWFITEGGWYLGSELGINLPYGVRTEAESGPHEEDVRESLRRFAGKAGPTVTVLRAIYWL